MEASRSRSPIWTVTPPSRSGSTAVRELDRRAGHRLHLRADGRGLVGGQWCGAGDDGHDDAPMGVQLALVLARSRARSSRDAAALDEQAHEPEGPAADPAAEQLVHRRERCAERDGRAVDDAARPRAGRACPRPARGRRASRRARRPAARPRRPPPRNAGRRWSGGPSAVHHRRRTAARSARNSWPRAGAGARRSSTRRRPAGRRSARSATSARSSATARCRSASISLVARSRSRAISSRVAASRCSRRLGATFWARFRISLASRRASWRVACRSCSAASRSRRACSASLRPCSMRARRSSRVLTRPPNAIRWTIREEEHEVRRGDDDPEQVDLELRLVLGRRQRRPGARPHRHGEDVHVGHRSEVSLRWLDEDREQADDDREHAEAFGERREDDREAADLAGRIGVAADRAGGQAGRGCRCRCPGR